MASALGRELVAGGREAHSGFPRDAVAGPDTRASWIPRNLTTILERLTGCLRQRPPSFLAPFLRAIWGSKKLWVVDVGNQFAKRGGTRSSSSARAGERSSSSARAGKRSSAASGARHAFSGSALRRAFGVSCIGSARSGYAPPGERHVPPKVKTLSDVARPHQQKDEGGLLESPPSSRSVARLPAPLVLGSGPQNAIRDGVGPRQRRGGS